MGLNLLVLTYRLPVHDCTADRYTIRHLVEYFGQRHRVVLAAFADSEEEAAAAGTLRSHCARVIAVRRERAEVALMLGRGMLSSEPLQVWFYRSRGMRRALREVCASEAFDAAYVYHLRCGQYLAGHAALPRAIALQPVQTLNLDRFRRYIRHPLRRLLYEVEYRRVRRYEPLLARTYDLCLLISERDREALDPDRKLENVFLNPHGVDPAVFRPDGGVRKQRHSLIFVGSLRYEANADAVCFFHREIFPLVRRRVPDVRLYIVGFSPPPAVRALAQDPAVVLAESVPDVVPYLQQAEVAIDPLRIGAGLQNKVLEGMAAGLPMVVTSAANEGIGARCGEHLLVADDPPAFAEAVIALLEDPGRRVRLGLAARRFVEENWSWERHFASLEGELEALVRRRRTANVSQRAAVA